MNRFRLAFVVIVLLLPITNCFGQASFNGIQRAEGWTIPGLKGARLTAKDGKAISKVVDIDGQKVTRTELVPGSKYGETEYFWWSKDGMLHVAHRQFQLAQLQRLEINGAVFAYSAGGPWVSIEKNGKVTPAGAVSNWTFVDLEGKGEYQLLLESDRPVIPAWVRLPKQ